MSEDLSAARRVVPECTVGMPDRHALPACLHGVFSQGRERGLFTGTKAASVYAVTALSDLLVARNTAGVSARAVARRAQELGHTLNHDTAARYLRGDHGNPDEATLVAFAEVLRIPLRDLRAAANLPSETTAPYVPPAEASRLTRRQRRAVDELIRAMSEPSRAVAAADDLAGRRRRAARRLAARHGKAEPPADG
jgi:transcriptional regulator with XRE-family HTH domain